MPSMRKTLGKNLSAQVSTDLESLGNLSKLDTSAVQSTSNKWDFFILERRYLSVCPKLRRSLLCKNINQTRLCTINTASNRSKDHTSHEMIQVV